MYIKITLKYNAIGHYYLVSIDQNNRAAPACDARTPAAQVQKSITIHTPRCPHTKKIMIVPVRIHAHNINSIYLL
ncbi:hypothetical protein [Chitinophaga sp. MD30]|uniref:hypothetical protein n=1 Tax=Chitinophaga sp. MD30 TaxID=2033437 RepID=UPI000BB01C5E|nr:hypothetical protein [Chitinophaga sp. MD30]ASZ13459.1 hypothetical protein CK934_22105 [Chitinophaga sp. MD30]